MYGEEAHWLDNGEDPLTGIRYRNSDDECAEPLEDERSLDLDSGSDPPMEDSVSRVRTLVATSSRGTDKLLT